MLFSFFLTAALADDAAWAHFGSPFTLTEVVSADTLLDDPSAFADKEVLVEGRVADVCQKAGCWMVVEDEGRTIRVLMKDHGFAVDKDGTDGTCRVQGTVVATELDPETVAHFACETEKPEVMPESSGEKVQYQLQATGVALQKKAD